MIKFLDLTPAHARQLHASHQPGLVLPEAAEALAAAVVPGLAFAGCVAGRVVGAGGILPQGPTRAVAWLIAPGDLPRRLWPGVRAQCRLVLAEAHARGYRRLEAFVHERFAPGLAFVAGLGFALEGHHPLWFPDGAGAFSFARFNPPFDSSLDCSFESSLKSSGEAGE